MLQLHLIGALVPLLKRTVPFRLSSGAERPGGSVSVPGT